MNDEQRRNINRLDYNYKTAAEWLGIKERYLHELVERRRITSVKIGALVRFRQIDLDEHVEICVCPMAARRGVVVHFL